MTQTLTDFISGREVDATAEEQNVQLLARWLVSLGYRREQIQTHPQYYIKGHYKRPRWPVDIAVFRDELRTDDGLILIAECKKTHSPERELGFDQLRRYLARTNAVVGIVFDGTDLDYFFRLRGVGPRLAALEGLESFPPYTLFSSHLRSCRKGLQEESWRQKRKFSLRQVAQRVGIEPSYLSKIERGKVPPPTETVVKALAEELGEDPDTLLIKAGKLPSDMEAALLLRPKLFADLIRQLKDAPDEAVMRIARQVKDGDW